MPAVRSISPVWAPTSALVIALVAAQFVLAIPAVAQPVLQQTVPVPEVNGLAMSPDGRHVYALQRFYEYSLFERDEDPLSPSFGSLTRVGTYPISREGVSGLGVLGSAAFSSDGRHLYAASDCENRLPRFERDPDSGLLTRREVYQLPWLDFCAGGGGTHRVVLSADGVSLYGASSRIAAFAREPETGALEEMSYWPNEESPRITSIATSPDDRFLYGIRAVDQSARFLDVYERVRPSSDSTTNLALRFSYDGGSSALDGLDNAVAMAVSPDGRAVYVIAGGSNLETRALTAFERNPVNGALTRVETHDGEGGVPQSPTSVVVSADGRHVFVTGETADQLVAFVRPSQISPHLELIGPAVSESGGEVSSGGWVMVQSPEGSHLYLVNRNDAELRVFQNPGAQFVRIQNLTATADPSGRVSLRWESRHEEGLTRYDVLRAYGVEPYETVRSVSPIGGPQRETIYEVDAGDSAPGAVSWRLQMTFESGRVTFSEPVVTIFPPEREVVLTGPYPNPASGSATLRVTLAGPGDVRVDLFDALGRRIRRVFSGRIEARVAHAVELDLAGLAAGQYFLHARADSPRGTFQSTAAVTVSR